MAGLMQGVAVAEEIASVSTCISSAPEGWIDLWKHNRLGFYDTLDLAQAITGDASGG